TRACRPDRPRHVRGDHGSAPGRARRRPLRTLPATARARRGGPSGPKIGLRLLRIRLTNRKSHSLAGFPAGRRLLSRDSSQTRSPPTTVGEQARGRSRILRILLVDDDPGLRTLLRTTFEVADVDVMEADGADAARRRIRAARPDVIVLDIHMPG